MNSITEKIFYIDDGNKNQRFVISAMTPNPRTWQVSKVEDMLMGEFGLMRLTFVQVAFNKSTDFIDYDAVNPDGTKDVYAMYANYYESSVPPVVEEDIIPSSITCTLSTSTNTIKIGGSYKTITATFKDSSDVDITDTYLSTLSIDNWHFYIDDVDVTSSGLIAILEQATANKIKVKCANNLDCISKVLVVKCIAGDVVGELSLEITSL